MDRKWKQTACFTGHRQIKESITEMENRVTKVVEHLIQNGYRYFGTGGARGFDALSAEVVLRMKRKYPNIHLILVLPFEEQYKQERNWRREEIEQYYHLRKNASKVVILENQYSFGVYYRRNRHLVDNSSYCIAYMTREKTGTSYTVHYATEKGIPVVNTAFKMP